MPIEFHAECVRLDGNCRLDEAEPLREWLQQHPHCAVDLSACAQLHTGVLQIILAHGRAPTALPTDPSLARWLAHYIEISPAL